MNVESLLGYTSVKYIPMQYHSSVVTPNNERGV